MTMTLLMLFMRRPRKNGMKNLIMSIRDSIPLSISGKIIFKRTLRILIFM